MKVALCTTTINIPHVLRLYRRCDPDVRFFVAGDLKTPHAGVEDFCEQIGNAVYFPPKQQDEPEWKSEALLPFNCIQRRNIATLEALRWGADIIVFADDDNACVDHMHFLHYKSRLSEIIPYFEGTERGFRDRRWSGLLASPEVDWFDVGCFLDPPCSHRGFPHEMAHRKPRLSHCVDVKTGAAAGIVLGDPDVSAVTRIACHPHVLNHSPLLNAGIAVDPRFTRTVFNTQNSAVLREFAPAMLLCPQFKRYDDIIASLVCQRVMQDTGHHVLFGPPFVYQERNAHSLTRDLADEQWGQENILRVQAALWRMNPLAGTTVQRAQACYWALDEMMSGVGKLADAWLEDCERAMA